MKINIKEWGFEKGVVITIEQFLDEYAAHRQHIRELTNLVAQCIDEIEKFIAIGDGLRNDIDRITRERKQDGSEC